MSAEENNKVKWTVNIRIPVTENEVVIGHHLFRIPFREIWDWYDASEVYLVHEVLKRTFEEWRNKNLSPVTFPPTFYREGKQ